MIDNKKMFWISSYPKSGNTWLRLILCGLFFTEDGNINDLNLLNKIPNFDSLENFNFIKNISIKDYKKIFKGNKYDEESVLTYSKYWIEAQKRIVINEGKFALFKTHNARIKINNNYYTDYSTTAGFIYIYRDPRDIAISYSKFMSKDIDETIDFILNGQIMGNKKINYKMPEIILSWINHYSSWKKFYKVPNLFLKYEDLLDNLELELNKIIYFFSKNYNIKISNKKIKIKNILNSTKFDYLKSIELKKGFEEKSKFSNFFRVGKKNQWKTQLKKNQIELINKELKDQLIKLNYK